MFIRKPIITIKSSRIARTQCVGGKAANLAILKKSGINVPDFFVVSADFFHRQKILKKASFQRRLVHSLETLNFPAIQVAIRSSATFEDSEQSSFAGQLESFLYQKNLRDVLVSIQKVWASSEKASVKSYTSHRNQGGQGVGVIVQQMIESRYSGVLFTADPLTNDDRLIRVEVVRGGCENLVNGSQKPAGLLIDKNDQTLAKVESENTDEEFNFIADTHKRQTLINLAQKAESVLGIPLDIEWTFDGTNFWILQARPISTYVPSDARIAIDARNEKWTDYFFAERFPEPVSPLGWTFLKPVIQRHAFEWPLWYLGRLESRRPLLKLIDGRPHAKLEAFHNLYAIIPRQFISRDKQLALALEQKYALSDLVKGLFYLICRLAFTNGQWFPLFNYFKWREFERTLDSKLAPMRGKNSGNSWLGRLIRAQQMSDRFLAIHAWSITFADIFYSLLSKALKIFKIAEYVSPDALWSGLPGNATVATNIALFRLDPDSEHSMHQFKMHYGHRAQSLDIAAATWAENEGRIRNMSRLLKQEKPSPLKKFEQARQRRCKAENLLFSELKTRLFPINILLVALFKGLLYLCQQFALMRENQRNAWHKILATARLASLEIGEELEAQNVLKKANDIFYLTLYEINAISDGRKIDAIQRIKKRKKSRKEVSKVLSVKSVQKEFSGIGVSNGEVIGRARICRNYEQVFTIQRGEILVVPAADPAWSPAFSVAAGMIMETGGVLSHASIVAREYKLPTVTSVKNATQLIRDGALLLLNGSSGHVSIIEQ